MKTSISLPGFSSPGASTEVPLEMLAACHTRVQRQCETLRRLVPHVSRHGCDEPARQAAQAVLRYFDLAARDHHADEEVDLFPALRQRLHSHGNANDPHQAAAALALIESLEAEHRTLEGLWAALRRVLQSVTDGSAHELPAQQVEDFVARYLRHIEQEDSALLPLATRLLDDAALDAIGRAMRIRRGIAEV